MSDSDSQRAELIEVGSRVTVIPTSGSRSSDTKRQAGVVVEDYSDTVIDHSALGRDWAPVLR